MRRVLSWVCGIVLVAAVGVGVVAIFNRLGWYGSKPASLWFGAWLGVFAVVGPRLIEYCERRGWIRGVFFNPRKREALADRRRKLAEKWQRLEEKRQEIVKAARK